MNKNKIAIGKLEIEGGGGYGPTDLEIDLNVLMSTRAMVQATSCRHDHHSVISPVDPDVICDPRHEVLFDTSELFVFQVKYVLAGPDDGDEISLGPDVGDFFPV